MVNHIHFYIHYNHAVIGSRKNNRAKLMKYKELGLKNAGSI